ncbi:MAG: sulfatase-like hydrolase/transferase [Saprospiraceae bacterium]
MHSYRQLVPAHLRFLVTVHLILLGIFSLFRYVTLLYNRPTYLFQMDHTLPLGEAFRIGFWFDIMVASYALLLPYLLLTVTFVRPGEHLRLFRFVRFYCGLAILVSLIICAADVPYFNFFNSRLTSSAIHWKNNVQVVKYLFSEIKYYPFILISGVCIWGTGRLMRALWQQAWSTAEPMPRHKWLAIGLASVLLLGGLWGGATPRTPDMKQATFSNDGFINQLTLNPVQTWFDSYFDFDVNLVPLEKATALVQRALGISQETYNSPIARDHHFTEKAKPMNVVLVLMESMSADRMGLFGNPKNLTPGLDSLARTSILFDNHFPTVSIPTSGCTAPCTACRQ